MIQYTFRLPPCGSGSAFVFDISAENEQDAVDKAKARLVEQANADRDIHVDLTYGLTKGRVVIDPDEVTEQAIVDKYQPPEDSLIF